MILSFSPGNLVGLILRTVDDKMFFQLIVFHSKNRFSKFFCVSSLNLTLWARLWVTALLHQQNKGIRYVLGTAWKTMIPFKRVLSRYFCNLGLFFMLRFFRSLEDVHHSTRSKFLQPPHIPRREMVIVATPVYRVVDAEIFQQKHVKNFVDFGYFRQFTSRDHRKNCWGKN